MHSGESIGIKLVMILKEYIDYGILYLCYPIILYVLWLLEI